MENVNYTWREDRLRRLMEQANMSISRLSKATGISPSTLVSYLQRKSSPSMEPLVRIADFFAVPVDYLIGRIDDDAIEQDYAEYFMMLRRAPYEAYLNGGRKELRITSCNVEAPWPYNLLDDVKGTEPWDFALNSDQEAGLAEAISSLGARDERLLRLYYEDGMTLDEVASADGVTRERVRQIVARGVRRLRHPVKRKLIELGLSGMEQERELTKTAEELRMKLKYVSDMESELRAKMAQIGTLTALMPKEAETIKVQVPRSYYDVPIDELDLSVRSWNCLRRAGIRTVNDACKAAKEHKLTTYRNLGKKSLVEILTKLKLFTGDDFFEEYKVEEERW